MKQKNLQPYSPFSYHKKDTSASYSPISTHYKQQFLNRLKDLEIDSNVILPNQSHSITPRTTKININTPTKIQQDFGKKFVNQEMKKIFIDKNINPQEYSHKSISPCSNPKQDQNKYLFYTPKHLEKQNKTPQQNKNFFESSGKVNERYSNLSKQQDNNIFYHNITNFSSSKKNQTDRLSFGYKQQEDYSTINQSNLNNFRPVSPLKIEIQQKYTSLNQTQPVRKPNTVKTVQNAESKKFEFGKLEKPDENFFTKQQDQLSRYKSNLQKLKDIQQKFETLLASQKINTIDSKAYSSKKPLGNYNHITSDNSFTGNETNRSNITNIYKELNFTPQKENQKEEKQKKVPQIQLQYQSFGSKITERDRGQQVQLKFLTNNRYNIEKEHEQQQYKQQDQDISLLITNRTIQPQQNTFDNQLIGSPQKQTSQNKQPYVCEFTLQNNSGVLQNMNTPKKQSNDQIQQKSTPIENQFNTLKKDPYELIKKDKNIDNYVFEKVLGLGSYAVVKLGIHQPSSMEIAIKTYDKKKVCDYQKKKNLQREIKILSKIRHPNIIRLYQVIDTDTQIHLIMEFQKCQAMNIFIKLQPQRKISESRAKPIFLQTVGAVQYCHRKCVVHRDIKLENLLIDEDRKNVKLCDFGFSIAIVPTSKLNIFCGTPSYMAPEIINKKEYSFGVDIWALGILLFKMITGNFPFRGKDDKELFKKINQCQYEYPPNISNLAKNLIDGILKHNPEERLSIDQIANDQWFQQTYEEKLIKDCFKLTPEKQIENF